MTLFKRKGRHVSPSPEAIRLANAYGEAEAIIANALTQGEARPVVISASPTFAARWLAPRLDDLRKAMSPIDMIVRSEVKLDAEADIFLRHGKEGVWPSLLATKLCDEIKAPVCAPSLVIGADDAAVARLPLIAVAARPTEWDEWSALAGVPLTSEPALQFEVTSTAWEAAVSGFGVVLGDLALLARELSTGQLVRIGETSLTTRSYWCCIERAQQHGSVIQAANWITAAARSEESENR